MTTLTMTTMKIFCFLLLFFSNLPNSKLAIDKISKGNYNLAINFGDHYSRDTISMYYEDQLLFSSIIVSSDSLWFDTPLSVVMCDSFVIIRNYSDKIRNWIFIYKKIKYRNEYEYNFKIMLNKNVSFYNFNLNNGKFVLLSKVDDRFYMAQRKKPFGSE